jgi:aconitate hydratase
MVAKKLVEFGFKRNPKVKTSFAPGSKVTAEILKQSGLQKYLDELGFNVVGFGCTTCNGSSGPLHKDIAETIENNKIFSTAVLSGNRNFQGRIHPNIRASYLASPALIVLFSLIGSTTKNLTKDSLGTDKEGKLVYLKDVWPENHEINTIVDSFYKPETFVAKYKEVNDGGELWENLAVSESDNYEWSDKSTYIKKPPYLENISQHTQAIVDIHLARPLVLLGDSVTTDHISPSSDITKTTAAWDYLLSQNIKPEDFNNFLTRRANHEIVKRSAFASLRLRNLMTPELEGSFTIKYPENKVMRIFEAATEYQKTKTELIVMAGENYGCGSSRDVAAKGPLLLGIRAIIAKGFERIHRSNLVGMGLLPLEFLPGNGIDELGIVATDLFTIKGLDKITIDHKEVDLLIQKESGDVVKVKLKARLDNPDEVIFWKNGGILQTAWKEA